MQNNIGITIKSKRELDLMRQSAKVLVEAKKRVADSITPGISTQKLDSIAEDVIRNLGAIPSFKGYTGGMASTGFPGTVCASINDEIVHGIPSKRKLNEGDILSIDVGAIVGGFHSDSAFTVGVGEITPDAQNLINATHNALKTGISKAIGGNRIGDISSAVQKYGESLGYGIVRQYVGHGIGRNLHEEPQVPNYGDAGKGPKLLPGMCLAIEPMLNVGTWKTKQLSDGWTVSTEDGELSAHFEDTIIITENTPENLTFIEGYY